MGTREIPDEGQTLAIVTGPSGAGRTTAIRALEDLGFEAIDNLPLSLLPRLLDAGPLTRPLALGVDARNRDFSSAEMMDRLAELAARPGLHAQLVYVDCAAEVLLRRFSETRRRHPLAPAESPQAGIAREADLLRSLRNRADVLIDTSEMTPHELRAEIERWFAPEGGAGLAVSVQSFAYKRGVPRGADYVFDCRFLKNPYWDPVLRPLDGRDGAVQAHVAGDSRAGGFLDLVAGLIGFLLPAHRDEGKRHLTLAFGCTGGPHRSVALAEALAARLAADGMQVSIRHRELDRRAQGRAAAE
jgi:RNase adapter protein RapZ